MSAVLIFFSGAYLFAIWRYPKKFDTLVEAYCKLYNVDEYLVYGVIWTESKFLPDAKSSAGAVGLMQLIPATAEFCAESVGVEFDESRLIEPKYNIQLGVFYLSYLLGKFSTYYAVCAYNGGEGNVYKWLSDYDGDIQFAETRDYVERVYKSMYIYRWLY